jgi:hypothetical protein
LSGPKLHRYPVIDTSVPDDMRDALVNVYGAREFDLRKNEERFRAIGNLARFKSLDLVYASYSAAVRINFPGRDLVRQHFPLSGSSRIAQGRSEFVVDAKETCVASP